MKPLMYRSSGLERIRTFMSLGFRKSIRRMRAHSAFQRSLARVRVGTTQADVLALLGPPDRVHEADPEAGIEFSWHYNDRLPDDYDLVVAFADGAVLYSSTPRVPGPTNLRAHRTPGQPNSP